MRSKSGPGGTLYHYGLCELAQRQAVLLRKDKSPDRAIKSDRAKVVMTAGCISKNLAISNYIYIPREMGNSANQNLSNKKALSEDSASYSMAGVAGLEPTNAGFRIQCLTNLAIPLSIHAL